MAHTIPRVFIDTILIQTDLVEFIDSYVPLKHKGDSHVALCPFHNEKTPSFHVIAKKQFYHCFGCGVSGNAISFAMKYLHLDFVTAIKTLASRLSLEVPEEAHATETAAVKDLSAVLLKVSKFFQKMLKTSGKSAIAYLKNRHISGEIAHFYQLGYAPNAWHTLETTFPKQLSELTLTGMVIQKDGGCYDRFRNRITFPIHNRHGQIIGFGARAIEAQQTPKYLNSPETSLFQKNRELYGLYQITRRNQPINNIIVVEGYMDVIALAQYGILNAVATLGTATNLHHLQLLNKYTKEVIFCFDGDEAGKQAAWRALTMALPFLHNDIAIKFVFLPSQHDPDSLVREVGADKFLEYLAQAISFDTFFFSNIMQNIDSTKITGKNQLLHAAKPYLQKMQDGPFKQLLIDELARMTRLATVSINNLVTDPNNSPAAPAINPVVNVTRSPTRIAVALLLQYPSIYADLVDSLPPSLLDSTKHRLLQTIMQQIANNRSTNTAMLIEAWRESPIFTAFSSLATWDHQVPEKAIAGELCGIINFLAKQTAEQKIQYLLEKARGQELTDLERLQLQDLLKKRHKKYAAT